MSSGVVGQHLPKLAHFPSGRFEGKIVILFSRYIAAANRNGHFTTSVIRGHALGAILWRKP